MESYFLGSSYLGSIYSSYKFIRPYLKSIDHKVFNCIILRKETHSNYRNLTLYIVIGAFSVRNGNHWV